MHRQVEALRLFMYGVLVVVLDPLARPFYKRMHNRSKGK